MATKKWAWRNHLTDEERKTITDADNLAEAIKRMKKNYEQNYCGPRRLIVNRAIKRAAKAAQTGGHHASQ